MCVWPHSGFTNGVWPFEKVFDRIMSTFIITAALDLTPPLFPPHTKINAIIKGGC